MVQKQSILLLVQAWQMLPRTTWQRLCDNLQGMPADSSEHQFQEALSTVSNADALWLLKKFYAASGDITPQQLSLMLQTIDAFPDQYPDLEILWSGPSNGLFPVRRFDQVLYDLVTTASSRILLVTFAASRIDILCSHLQVALRKGVQVSLVLEAESHSEGQLSYDAIYAFGAIAKQGCSVYYWPLEKRERNAAGRPGKLHAKCAVIDNQAVVGSANLTDDAFNRNLELGLLVRNSAVVYQIYDHFMSLISNQVLQKL